MIEINRDPPPRLLRQFAASWILFVGLAGWIVLRKTELLPLTLAIWVIAVGVGALGLVRPRSVRLIWLGLAYATFPIGWVVSHLVLAAVFYLLFTPIGVIMRLLGHDPLRRRADPSASSYWVPRKSSDDAERYFRQF